MKLPGIYILALSLVAAVIGIYFATTSPYTHIAAAAVAAATAIAIVQERQSANEAAYVRHTLNHLARSIPPSFYWRDRVTDHFRRVCEQRGYRFMNQVLDTRNLDPDARAIYTFSLIATSNDEPSGMIVLAPEDYADLSIIERANLDAAIGELMFGHWGTDDPNDQESIRLIGRRIRDIAVSLYGLSRLGQGFRISTTYPDPSSPSLVIGVGKLELSFAVSELEEFFREPPIVRTLRIAEAVEDADSAISQTVKHYLGMAAR